MPLLICALRLLVEEPTVCRLPPRLRWIFHGREPLPFRTRKGILFPPRPNQTFISARYSYGEIGKLVRLSLKLSRQSVDRQIGKLTFRRHKLNLSNVELHFFFFFLPRFFLRFFEAGARTLR